MESFQPNQLPLPPFSVGPERLKLEKKENPDLNTVFLSHFKSSALPTLTEIQANFVFQYLFLMRGHFLKVHWEEKMSPWHVTVEELYDFLPLFRIPSLPLSKEMLVISKMHEWA